MSKIIKQKDSVVSHQNIGVFFSEDRFISTDNEYNEKLTRLHELRTKAETEAEHIVNEAKKQAIIEEQNGFDEGVRRAIESMKPIEATLSALQKELKDSIVKYPAQLEPEVIKLVMHISRKVIKHHVEKDDELVVRTVRDAFKEITDRRYVKIRLHRDSVETMQKFRPELLQSFHDIKKLEIVADESIDRGGCIVETDEGNIDATIQTQLDNIEKLFVCDHETAETIA